jgi:lipopolysaccharide/colanic/teichoic acid biosynthesis glycosyltransferase
MDLNSVKKALPQSAASKPLSYQLSKRCFDIIISLAAIIVLSPIILLVAICIFVIDGGPVTFKQERAGIHNKRFIIWKFRTMKGNLQSKHHNYNWMNGIPDDQNIRTTSSIPDITKTGSFLRKYSLDELPQLFNVLIGDMSIVGPRPEIPEIARHYNERQLHRLEVKPGITGYAQINGRSDMSHGDKIKHDLYYIDNCSISLDLKIILKTIIVVIFRKGAY